MLLAFLRKHLTKFSFREPTFFNFQIPRFNSLSGAFQNSNILFGVCFSRIVNLLTSVDTSNALPNACNRRICKAVPKQSSHHAKGVDNRPYHLAEGGD